MDMRPLPESKGTFKQPADKDFIIIQDMAADWTKAVTFSVKAK